MSTLNQMIHVSDKKKLRMTVSDGQEIDEFASFDTHFFKKTVIHKGNEQNKIVPAKDYDEHSQIDKLIEQLNDSNSEMVLDTQTITSDIKTIDNDKEFWKSTKIMSSDHIHNMCEEEKSPEKNINSLSFSELKTNNLTKNSKRLVIENLDDIINRLQKLRSDLEASFDEYEI